MLQHAGGPTLLTFLFSSAPANNDAFLQLRAGALLCGTIDSDHCVRCNCWGSEYCIVSAEVARRIMFLTLPTDRIGLV